MVVQGFWYIFFYSLPLLLLFQTHCFAHAQPCFRISAIEAEIMASLNRNVSGAVKSNNPTSAAAAGGPFRMLAPADLESLRAVAGNNVCVDCGAEAPTWASLNLGVLMCISCSGIHRNLGVHISRVRSLELDDFRESFLEVLKRIGNANGERTGKSLVVV